MKLLKVLIVAVFIGIIGFFTYALAGVSSADDLALKSLDGNERVIATEEKDYYIFENKEKNDDTAIVFYPGGKVDEKAYAHLMLQISEKGYRVYLMKMPLNLAVFSPEKADVIEGNFIIMGHSLGGAMAAKYAYDHLDQVEGLVLLASYPADSNDLSDTNLDVLSIYGSEDGLATGEKIEDKMNLLPSDTHYVEIEGGNHAGFGNYGVQKGDGEATISSDAQQKAVIKFVDGFMKELKEDVSGS